MTIDITFNGETKSVQLKYTLRAMLMYENVTNTSFNPVSLNQLITYLYCIIMCSGDNSYSTYKQSDLISDIDNNPNIIMEFAEWYKEVATNAETLKKN